MMSDWLFNIKRLGSNIWSYVSKLYVFLNVGNNQSLKSMANFDGSVEHLWPKAVAL